MFLTLVLSLFVVFLVPMLIHYRRQAHNPQPLWAANVLAQMNANPQFQNANWVGHFITIQRQAAWAANLPFVVALVTFTVVFLLLLNFSVGRSWVKREYRDTCREGAKSDLYCDIIIDMNYFVDKGRYTMLMGFKRIFSFYFNRVVWGN